MMTLAIISSPLPVAALEYFAGERREMIAMITGAGLFSVAALRLYFATRTGFAFGFMATVLVFATLMSAASISFLLRDAKSASALSRSFERGRESSTVSEETVRIRVVISKYRYYRYGAAAIGLVAIAGLLTLNRGWIHGVAAGLLLLVPAQVLIDHFSERRAHTYLQQLNYSAFPFGRSNL